MVFELNRIGILITWSLDKMGMGFGVAARESSSYGLVSWATVTTAW